IYAGNIWGEGKPMNLEDALQEEEARVEGLLKDASRCVSALKAWKKAAQTGNIGARQKAVAQADELARALPAEVAEATSAWGFDVRSYLEGEHWRRELQETASEKYGLRVLEE